MDKCYRKITKVFNSMTVIWVVALLCLALTGGAFLSIVKQPGYSVGRPISSNVDGSASNSNNANDKNATNINNNDNNVNIPNPHPEPIPSTPAPAIPNPSPTFPSPFSPSGGSGGGVDHWTYGGIPVPKTAATTTSTLTRNSTNTGLIPSSLSTAAYDKIKGCAVDQQTSTNTETYLTHFACGHISPIPASVPHNSTNVLRKFTLFVHENVSVPITPTTFAPNQTVYFNGWTFN